MMNLRVTDAELKLIVEALDTQATASRELANRETTDRVTHALKGTDAAQLAERLGARLAHPSMGATS